MSVPYLGDTISLISRALIRYEGTLAGVDPKAATISLENGKPALTIIINLFSLFLFKYS